MSFAKSSLLSALFFVVTILVNYIFADNSDLLLNSISALLFLISSFILCNDIQSLRVLENGRNNYISMTIMSSLLAVGAGADFYFTYSLSLIFFVIVFRTLTSNSFSSEPIASQIFKLVLFAFILGLFRSSILLMLAFLIMMILSFRGPIIMDLLATIASILVFVVIVFWANWFFETDFIDLRSIFSFEDFFIALRFDNLLSNVSMILLSVMVLFLLISWLYAINSREMSDNLWGRLMLFIFFLTLILIALLLVLGGYLTPNAISLFALPYAVLFPIQLSKIRTRKMKKVAIYVFVLILVFTLFAEYSNLQEISDYIMSSINS